MIDAMRHRGVLLLLLVTLCTIGLVTVQTALSPDLPSAARFLWLFLLVVLPLALGAVVWVGWTWTAMACVIYGTVGLALDLATVTSILGGKGGVVSILALSGISGAANLSLIVFGGRAFWSGLQGGPPPGPHPPNPPSPFSSSAT